MLGDDRLRDEGFKLAPEAPLQGHISMKVVPDSFDFSRLSPRSEEQLLAEAETFAWQQATGQLNG